MVFLGQMNLKTYHIALKFVMGFCKFTWAVAYKVEVCITAFNFFTNVKLWPVPNTNKKLYCKKKMSAVPWLRYNHIL